MENISIRLADLSDANTLCKIGAKTFFETYAQRNSVVDMQQYLAANFNKQAVAKQIEHAGSTFYIAYLENEPIGYLKLNTAEAQTDLKEHDSIEIERIYVLAAYHGKNIGQLLYQKAVTMAKEKGKSSIWLGVWEQNPRAIRFYEKQGFEKFDTHIFVVGSEEQTDYLMRKLL